METISLVVDDDPSAAESFDEARLQGGRCKNPDCRSGRIVTDMEAGDVCCGDCGWVLHARVEDPGRDWRGSNATNEKGDTVERATEKSRLTMLLDGAGDIVIEKQGTQNQGFRGQEAQSEIFRQSKKDRLLYDVRATLQNFCKRLPGEVFDDIEFHALELFLLMWEESGRKLRRTTSLLAACVWTICSILSLPFVMADFHKALAPYEDEPKKKLHLANRHIGATCAKSAALKKFLKGIKLKSTGADQYGQLCTRWASNIGVPYAVGVYAHSIGKVLRGSSLTDQGRFSIEVLYSTAIYMACHRPDAPEAEEGVTASTIAAFAGADVAKIERCIQTFVEKKDGILTDAAQYLPVGTKKTLCLA